jgi:hypothetical protein
MSLSWLNARSNEFRLSIGSKLIGGIWFGTNANLPGLAMEQQKVLRA